MTERPPAEDELLVDDGEDDAAGATQLDLPLEIELEPGGEPTPTRTLGERARFVAESPPLGSDGRVVPEVSDDDPTIALGTLAPDDPDAHSTVRLRRMPPALPASLRPPGPTPKVLLGPGLSTRNEITERVSLIPKTHPMANSVAPGGSALSMTPAPKRAPRGLFAAGAAALALLGVGAAHYMQSRGENHAAAERAEGTHAAARVVAVALPGAAGSTHAPAEPIDSDAPPADVARLSAEATAAGAPPRPEIAASAPQAAPPKTVPTVRAAAAASARPLKLEVGEAALRPSQRPFRPSLGAITAAIEGVRDQVRACAGDAHGLADVVLRVQASGVVSHVQVQSGPFADGPAGSCIARALRKARVAPFRKPVAHVLYTIRL